MTIAYIRTYSNKQQTESQKNAIEQFAKAKKIEIDKWLKDAKNSSKEKNRLEDVIKNLQEGDILIVADVTRLSRKLMEIMHLILLCIAELADYYKVSLSGFKRFIRENIPNLPSRRKKKNDTE